MAGALVGVALAGAVAAADAFESRGAPRRAAAPIGSHPAARLRQSASPSNAAPSRPSEPLAGKVIGIDPGHNGRNYTDPAYLNAPIWNGRAWEACDTTGTSTDSGYPEARFTFQVAQYLRADLVRDGATVVMTRTGNQGVGPCVDRRARLLNRAHAVVSVDIHGDGGPAWGRGFSILEPVADGPNDKVIGASQRLASDMRSALESRTPMPASDYYGHQGLAPRSDLAGLNLTTEPKVLLECGNMRNAQDARLLTSASFQRLLAKALAAAIVKFVAGG